MLLILFLLYIFMQGRFDKYAALIGKGRPAGRVKIKTASEL